MRAATAGTLIILLAGSCVGCTHVAANAPNATSPSGSSQAGPQVGRQVGKFLGPERVAILQQADRVETYRVKNPFQTSLDDPGPRVANLVWTAQGKPLTKPQIAELQNLVLSDSSYEWEVAKGCEPAPGVVFRVFRKKEYVDVVVCFDCEMWAFGLNTQDNESAELWEDFDPVVKPLAALAKAAFPDDEVIQGLP